MDDAYCGGGDTNEGITNTAIPISTAAQAKIAAAILMGDPRHIPGLTYNVGTCQASGVRYSFSTHLLSILNANCSIVRAASGWVQMPLRS
jgi:hypothetical protein